MKKTATVALLAVLAAGCTSQPRKSTITVFAAASLTGTFTKLAHDFEKAHPGTTVRLSFAGSTALATQIETGKAPADVFASASTKAMQRVTRATGVKTFANNAAEIAAAPGADVTSLADLARVKVALCDPTVPCGELAKKVLANAHVTVKPLTYGLDVKSTLGYVTTGSADAAIVYVTDVLAAGSKVRGVQIPPALNASTAYSIATVSSSPLAKAFEEYVLSDAAQSVLLAAGFEKP